jgi:CubicO group peptidase (beta-lactamase class C family)
VALAAALTDVDSIFDRFAARQIVPGLAYGVIVDGELVHAAGLGTLRVGEPMPPDSQSVFRIASMTKSFTAAAVLLLRDEGRLRLDDHVARWVPELADLPPLTADSPSITIDHLLTMTAGLPTDDPWGDRQQGLALGDFADFLRAGPGLAWAPGTHFEYSNLGYGILGRVVTNSAGMEYREFVRQRLLLPLGMTATAFLQEDVPTNRLALGYVRRDDAWLEEPIDPYGALASMGGVFTSVDDLARWVAGFTDAFPARDEPPGGHPLCRATRREMQQIRRPLEPELTWRSADGTPIVMAGGYGYGLFIAQDLRFGRIVGHGGGYPGFGSNMRWHPTSGIGVVAFGNARYAPMVEPVREALSAVLSRETGRIRRTTPWPAVTDARSAIERLIERWDEEAASILFSMNVDLDEPLARRRAAIERLREIHGPLRPDEATEPESHSPAHLAWWMTGDRGRVRVEILLSPERPPRVQALTFRSIPEPPTGLSSTAARLAALLGRPGPRWPSDIPLAASADRNAIERGLRAAEARYGPVTLDRPTAGDGVNGASWRLRGDRGDVTLELALDAPDGSLTSVAFVPMMVEAPDEPD